MSSIEEIAVELIEERSALPLSAGEWNGLVAGNETNSIFQTFEWFDVWWRSFGDRYRLFFLLLRRGEQPIGFAALMLRRNALGLRHLEFVGTGNADYQDFVLPIDKPRALAAVCRFLQANSHRWDRAVLLNVPERSSTMEGLKEWVGQNKLRLVEEARVRCPTLTMERASVQRLINKYSLRRPFNWFRRHGCLRLRHVSVPDEIQALLPVFFAQHRERWRAKGRPSLFEDPTQRAFYVALASALHSKDWLLFSVLELNGQPIAFHFGFDYSGSVIWYKPSFDIRYATHSPGLLLMRQLIEDALLRSRRELDFTIGDEAFKSRFASDLRFNAYISIYHNRLLGALAQGLASLRRRAGQAARARAGFAPSGRPGRNGGAAPQSRRAAQ